jgi:hypothetical protein
MQSTRSRPGSSWVSRATLAALFAALCCAGTSGAEPGTAATAESQTNDAAPAVTGGMRVGVDPHTGALLPNPPPVPVPERALSHSAVGLVEAPAPGGGVMIDLQGRFRSTMVGTASPDGGVRAGCVTDGTPATGGSRP